jgi:hypothetical protein
MLRAVWIIGQDAVLNACHLFPKHRINVFETYIALFSR